MPPEQKADAPDCSKADNAVNNSCKHTVLTAANPGNKVKFEKTDKPPVDAAYDI